MPKGRTQTWTCFDCKASFTVQNQSPKMCCFCGSDRILKAKSSELLENYLRKIAETKQVREQYESILVEYVPIRDKYEELVKYWRQQLTRKYISEEDFRDITGVTLLKK